MNFKKEDILDALGIENNQNWLSIALVGFGIGCVVGGAVALMLAPKSGREIREDLMDRSRDLMQRGREFVGQETQGGGQGTQSNLGRSPTNPQTY